MIAAQAARAIWGGPPGVSCRYWPLAARTLALRPALALEQALTAVGALALDQPMRIARALVAAAVLALPLLVALAGAGSSGSAAWAAERPPGPNRLPVGELVIGVWLPAGMDRARLEPADQYLLRDLGINWVEWVQRGGVDTLTVEALTMRFCGLAGLRIGGDVEVGDASQPFLQRDRDLGLGQVRTDAAVRAGAEGQVVVDLAMQVDLVLRNRHNHLTCLIRQWSSP